MPPTFDQAELMDRIEGDVEFLEECIEIFDEDAAPLVAQIREAVAASDAAALTSPAHTLKGMLSNFCAPAAEGAAHDLEKCGRENQLDDCGSRVNALEDELKRLRTDLQSFLESLQS